jgi:DNA mismatch repair protein MutS
MVLIDDLRLEQDVLPLFNYTNNDGAEAALRRLLTELPGSPALVAERQAIIRALADRWVRLADFSYSRLQFADAHQLLHDVTSGRMVLDAGRLRASLRLLLSERARYEQRAKFVQLIQLLRRLQLRLLRPLAGAELPGWFRAELEVIRRLAERLGAERLDGLITEDAFSIGEQVTLIARLRELTEADVTAFWTAFYRGEAYWALTKGVMERGFALPEFRPGTFQLTDFFHPLLRQPVTNTLTLAAGQNVLLLTGPNMSGKSTLLKAVSLCVYLAHAGVGVPARGAVLPFFRSLAVAINLNDSLRDGYSHFMTEIQNLKAVLLAAAEAPTFAVFDELFRGTNADDALDITRSTLAGLGHFSQSYFLISTHLLALAGQLPAAENIQQASIACVLTAGLPRFTYQLQPGSSQLRIGRILFEQAGLPALLGAGR